MASFGRKLTKLEAKNGITSFTYLIESKSAVHILLTLSITRHFALAKKHFDDKTHDT
jgi:hypothetical protein